MTQESFWSEKIALVAGEYSREELVFLATGVMQTTPVKQIVDENGVHIAGDDGKITEVDDNGIVLSGLDINGASDEMTAVEVAPAKDEPLIDQDPIKIRNPDDAEEIAKRVSAITWDQKEPPKGMPHITMLFKHFAWIRNDKIFRDAVQSTLFTEEKTPRLQPNLNAFCDELLRSSINESMRWLLSVLRKHVTPLDVNYALSGHDALPLVKRMQRLGFHEHGLKMGSIASDEAVKHPFMMDILTGRREDGVPLPLPADQMPSCAGIMKALRAAVDAISPPSRAKMVEHMNGNADDHAKALAPLSKLMTKTGPFSNELSVLKSMVSNGSMPISDLADIFNDQWEAAYGHLTGTLRVIGPNPPWLSGYNRTV